MNTYKKYYLCSLIGVILATFYPIYMGVKVISDYFADGSIYVTNYPKYFIPYTPISVALIFTITLLPIVMRISKRFTLPIISALGVGIFFISEIYLENVVVMDGLIKTSIQRWQMFSCAATPQLTERYTDLLTGEYNPAFKIHFYIISAVLILAILNVVYGFSKMIKNNNYEKKAPLIAQSISTVIFIGLCVLACFTAFYRKGNLSVSPVSALLMSTFFIIFGITMGVYIGSIFYGKKKLFSIVIPSVISMLITIVMYVGELILLNGVLFKFGSGFLFEPLGIIPFALIDIIVILLSGAATYTILGKIQIALCNEGS